MRTIIFFLAAIMSYGMASAQLAGAMRGKQEAPLPEGFKPSSTNIFLAQYPAVNAQTRQAMFHIQRILHGNENGCKQW